ncbi:MAG: TlpA family protein disulfide reductase, partial [Flavobacteriaceae bacterium]|nr:TlpA family protein disulfide reductase [Flavobacteriaceae bacterium]
MIRRISLLLFISLLFVACKQNETVKDYLTLSGTITNTLETDLVLNGLGLQRELKLDDHGSFRDTMKIEEGFYLLSYG